MQLFPSLHVCIIITILYNVRCTGSKQTIVTGIAYVICIWRVFILYIIIQLVISVQWQWWHTQLFQGILPQMQILLHQYSLPCMQLCRSVLIKLLK